MDWKFDNRETEKFLQCLVVGDGSYHWKMD